MFSKESEYSNLMWLAFHGNGATYYYVLNSDRVLEASEGIERYGSELQYVDYLSQIIKKDSVKISKKEFQNIIKLADIVEKSSNKEVLNEGVVDSIEIDLYYKGNIYKTNFARDFKSLSNLCGEIVHLSPIKVDYSTGA